MHGNFLSPRNTDVTVDPFYATSWWPLRISAGIKLCGCFNFREFVLVFAASGIANDISGITNDKKDRRNESGNNQTVYVGMTTIFQGIWFRSNRSSAGQNGTVSFGEEGAQNM